jgi:hypothetical protein
MFKGRSVGSTSSRSPSSGKRLAGSPTREGDGR